MSQARAPGQRQPAADRRRKRSRRAAGEGPEPRAAARQRPRRAAVRQARLERRKERLRGAAAGFVDPRRQLAITATITVIGLAMVGIRESFIGALITLLGCLAFMWAIHKYGRLGPEGG